MNVFHFQCNGFSGSVEGINGSVAEHANDNQLIAESCDVEVVEDFTLKKWKKCITKEDLDGLVLIDIPDIVSAIKNALDDDIPTTSLTLAEMSSGDLSMTLSFPVLLRTTSIEFSLETVEQDEVSILKQRVEFLTVQLRESKQQQQELKENEKNERELLEKKIIQLGEWKQQTEEEKKKEQQEKLELERKVTQLKQEHELQQKQQLEKMRAFENEKILLNPPQKFVECGEGLSISNCGMMVARRGSSDGWRSVTVGETMLNGIYYAEVMTLRMNSAYSLRCGVVSSTATNLICFDANDGQTINPGSSWISTGLPGCKGMNGCIIVGVLLNLEENNIQYFLNGVASDSAYDIGAGEYKFTVSLYHQWDAVKLLSIEKRK